MNLLEKKANELKVEFIEKITKSEINKFLSKLKDTKK